MTDLAPEQNQQEADVEPEQAADGDLLDLPDDKPSPERIAAAEQQIVDQSKRIEFYIVEYSVETLADKMKKEDYFVPNYQRQFTWEHARKSRFIESVIMGLPIPFLFFWEVPESGKLEIVDGSQRLRTLQEFVLGDLRLGELESLTELSGLRFRDLPTPRQRKITNRSIRGIVLNEHADDQARFDLFERINTGSLVANPTEVRRGALTGPFMRLVEELSADPQFAQIAPVPAKQEKLRARDELVTRFFAYSDGLEGYRDRPSQFLWDYTKKMNAEFAQHPELVEGYRARFRRMVDFVARTFPHGFRKGARGTTTPRARFEAIAVGSHLALDRRPELADATVGVEPWIAGDNFRVATTSDGANAIALLRGRMHFVRDRLLEALAG